MTGNPELFIPSLQYSVAKHLFAVTASKWFLHLTTQFLHIFLEHFSPFLPSSLVVMSIVFNSGLEPLAILVIVMVEDLLHIDHDNIFVPSDVLLILPSHHL